MNVTCDKCNKRYAIADDKVRGKSVKIRCKQCQNLISVQGPPAGEASAGAHAAATLPITPSPYQAAPAPGAPWEEERTRAMPSIDLSPVWFAMVKGKQIGPLTVRDLELRVKSSEVSLRTYLWKQGMADWKRASDVPEVATVFAGVSVGAAAVGAVQAPLTQTSTQPARAPVAAKPAAKPAARDVATANELPSPEITRKPNGNGHGAQASPASQTLSTTAPALATRPKTGQFQRADTTQPALVEPGPAAAPAREAKSGSRPAVTEKKPAHAPAAQAKTDLKPAHDERTALITDEEPAHSPGGPTAGPAPLNDLFNDVSGLNPKGDEPATGEGPISGLAGPANGNAEPLLGGAAEKGYDPFAALGEADPKDAPPPGEATKFFIAQAGVNKRNPPWKIALFIIAIVGLPVGLLFMLSKLHVVPPVLVQNEKGEMVEQEFFSPQGFSTGLKDLLSGDAKKKKADAEAARRAAAEKQKKVASGGLGNQHAGGNDGADALPGRRDNKPENPKYSEEELKKLYGSGGPTGSDVSLGSKSDVGPKVRLESQAPTVEKGGGLDGEAVAKTMGQRMPALVGCVEDALKRNPNVKLEKVTLVMQVGTSGAVKGAGIEPKRVELTDWGGCIIQRAKKISFPPADSESEIQLPLVLGASMQ
ncbi:MAG: zinc-ribbon domain-containing protein [Myxococcaceae bacterium]|nr:zinc-ribbon domain-containing protein [Myxococcaceae bacterium]